MLHEVEESTVLFRDAEVEYVGRALTQVAMQRRDILSEEPQEVSPPRAMKAGAEAQRVSLSPEYVTAMIEVDHIGLECGPAVDFSKGFVFGWFPRTRRRDISRSECLDVGSPPDFENPVGQL